MIIKSTFAILTRPDRLQSLIGQLRSRYASDRVHPGILLVEGINDVGTFKAFLAKVPGSRKPTKDQEFLILPLGGNTLVNGSRGEELREFTRLRYSRIAAIVDSERSGHGEPPDKAHMAFKLLCDQMGIRCYVLERRSIECYFDEAAIQSVYGPTFTAFGAYGTQPYGWHNQQNAAVARAMDIESIAGTDLERILREL